MFDDLTTTVAVELSEVFVELSSLQPLLIKRDSKKMLIERILVFIAMSPSSQPNGPALSCGVTNFQIAPSEVSSR